MISGDRKLGLAVALCFLGLFAAWAVLFTLAANNRVADVPLAHKTTPSPKPQSP
jgi:hypothetical protein